jgi:hypothetical protein
MRKRHYTLSALESHLKAVIRQRGIRPTARLASLPVNQVYRYVHDKGQLYTGTLDRLLRSLGYEVHGNQTRAAQPPTNTRAAGRRSQPTNTPRRRARRVKHV